jgi:hypothetical protein
MVHVYGDAMAGARKRESIPDLVREAISDGRDWLKAEIDLFRAQLSDAAGKYTNAAIALAVAAILGFAGLMYLALAAMLTLAPYLGNAGSALVVGGALIVIALAASLYARMMYRRARVVPPRVMQALAERTPTREEP